MPGRSFAPGTLPGAFDVRDGTWSPSARRIAFVGESEQDAEELTLSTIYTIASDGSGLTVRSNRAGGKLVVVP